MTRRWPGLEVGPPDRDTDPDRLARVIDDDPVGPLWRGAQIFRLLSYLYALGFHIAVTDLSEQTSQVAGRAEKLEGRLALLQTAQDLLKVRLLLLEENARSAQDTLTLAIAHLEQAAELIPEQAQRLQELQGRMAGLGELIEERSFRAAPELESLWADVMDLVLPTTLPPAEERASEIPVEPSPTPAP